MKRYISCGVFSGFSQPRKPILNYLLLRIELVQKEKKKSFFFGKREQNDFSQPDFGGNLAN